MKEINWFQFYQEITQSKARVIEILVHWRPGSLQINQTWMNGCSRSNTKNEIAPLMLLICGLTSKLNLIQFQPIR
ncbi:Uncharacterized protein TCM_007106 [Theobroma cacao]|uniref:Uncharacterized protein n=1 Tax=Theobroma cacao TaxID=3641 RepID=A0A061DZW6_THECC|nr:Uncharacterized protein TCM_007106 [Theobroma cacao]